MQTKGQNNLLSSRLMLSKVNREELKTADFHSPVQICNDQETVCPLWSFSVFFILVNFYFSLCRCYSIKTKDSCCFSLKTKLNRCFKLLVVFSMRRVDHD